MASISDKAGILAELWINYRDEGDFSQFIEYNDIGLPLAYYVAEGLVNEATPLGEQYISESFDMFLTALDLDEKVIDELQEVNLNSVLNLSMIKKENKKNNPE